MRSLDAALLGTLSTFSPPPNPLPEGGGIGRWLVAGFRRGVHVELGFGSFAEYVHRLFGFSVRATEERVRTAAALEALPSLAGLAAAGALSSACSAR